MSWLNKLFSRKEEISPEQVIIAEPPPLPARRPADAYVDLKKLAIKDDEPVAGMANQQQISGIKKKSPGVLSYAQSRHRAIGEGGYLAPEYDLAEVGVVEDVESWVRQAFYKKIALMNKEGFDFVGKNPKTIRYTETRLAQIARASRISINQLLRSIGSSLIRMSNAFLVKQRDPKASGGKIRQTPENKTLKPVAAYFMIPAETMRVKLDKQGNVSGWRQEMPDGQYKDFRKEDICHFHIRRKDGFVFGTPDLIPVLDDIRALRNIEETIELLCHKHLFPLFQYIVGTPEQPAGMTEDNEDEVEVVRREIQYMPAEGGIVTPERHKIEVIGAEGKAMKAEGYLDYFKLRVIAGLGISEMDLGTGDCHDELTQTLTENGWKFHHEIDHLNERIATYNPETQRVEFHIAPYKYEGLYSNDMICFTGKHLDMKVTPHHDMWVKSRWGREFQKVQAQDLLDNKFAKEFYMLETAPWTEEEYDDEIFMPSNAKKRGKARDYILDAKKFAPILGYYIAEGCKNKPWINRYRFYLSQNVGDSLNRMTAALQECGLSYHVRYSNTRPGQATIQVYGRALYDFISREVPGNSHSKRIPDRVWSWSKEARQKLLDALIDGDGTITKKGNKIHQTYYTVNPKLADDVQRLALSLGFAAKIKRTQQSENSFGGPDRYIYRVYISGDGSGPVYRLVNRKMISKVHYTGTIYCYNVPNHLFLTRRNGCVTIQGNTANRGTARVLSRQLIDTVKDIQDTIEEQFFNEVVSELLLESTFTFDTLAAPHLVKLQYKEIDLENRIEQEKHAAEMFEKNGITYSEFRNALGREPIEIPMDPEDQDPTKYPDWHSTHWKLFREPEFIIRAIDEAWTVGAKAAAQARSLGTTQQQLKESDKEQQQKEKRQADENIKVKAASSKPKPAASLKNTIDGFIEDRMKAVASYRELEKDIVEFIQASFVGNVLADPVMALQHIKASLTVWANSFAEQLAVGASTDFITGFNKVSGGQAYSAFSRISVARDEIRERTKHHMDKLAEDLYRSIAAVIDGEDSTQTKTLVSVRATFDAYRFRIRFISTTEMKKAKSYGMLLGRQHIGITEFESVPEDDNVCEDCLAMTGRVYSANDFGLDNVAPYHPGCRCKLLPKD